MEKKQRGKKQETKANDRAFPCNNKALPYIGFTVRIIFAIFAFLISMLVFLDLLTRAGTRFSYGLCFLIPVAAVVVIGGDLYLRYKLDIRPLRTEKKR